MATVVSVEFTEQNHLSLEIDFSNEELFHRIKGKIQPMPSSQCCIYKIPECLRTLSEDAYVPKIVSIGPFHRDKESLQAMEEHKKWYLHALLSRTSSPDKCLKDFLEIIRAMEVDIRASYAELAIISSDEFVEMMLLDACFIVELFYNYGKVELRDDNDPIYITSWMLSSLKHDLILLENQLPFFLLEILFEKVRSPEIEDLFLEEYVKYFFRDVLPTVEHHTRNPKEKIKHLLDLIRNEFFSSSGETEVVDYTYGGQLIECATELSNAGMRFEATHITESLLDITLSEEGVFKIPLFFFDETVSYLLGNLIALEQCDSDYASLISSYVVLLDALISTSKDVRLLRREGIIDSVLRDDEEIVLIIKRLCKGFTVTKFYYTKLCSRANAYYRTGWNKWRADLKRDYINTLRRDYFNNSKIHALALQCLESSMTGTNRVAGHLANLYPGNCMHVEITPSSFTEHLEEINVGDSSGTEYEILDRGHAIGLHNDIIINRSISDTDAYWFYEYCGVGHPIVKEDVKYYIDYRTVDTITWEPWLESAVSEMEGVLTAKLISRKRMPLQVPNGNYEYYLGDRCWRQLAGEAHFPLDPLLSMSLHISPAALQEMKQAGFLDCEQFVVEEERETYATYWAEQTLEVGHMLTDSQRMGNIDLFRLTALRTGITLVVVTLASVHSLSQDFSLPGEAEGSDPGWHIEWTGRHEMLPIARMRDLSPISSSYDAEKLWHLTHGMGRLILAESGRDAQRLQKLTDELVIAHMQIDSIDHQLYAHVRPTAEEGA
ncbi:hypothetical protein GIB67_030127 [Kingdonia uniflora]|uniref:Uncharacterized protein n=1 Tax=Kingdonia uniflora TaxID=39325 RepID=A0A7J7NTZ2_9MAGN|nr:hypothetical protein GIB67_030127 [Kingdonia uniflora]